MKNAFLKFDFEDISQTAFKSVPDAWHIGGCRVLRRLRGLDDRPQVFTCVQRQIASFHSGDVNVSERTCLFAPPYVAAAAAALHRDDDDDGGLCGAML